MVGIRVDIAVPGEIWSTRDVGWAGMPERIHIITARRLGLL